jgi:hypothetical protein
LVKVHVHDEVDAKSAFNNLLWKTLITW